MGDLTGKVAFITGVARGQGRAHAVRLAREGADIVGVDLAGPLPGAVPYDSATLTDLDETRRQVEAEGRRAHLVQGDTRDHDRLAAVVSEGVELFGGLDVVVANAGICVPEAWHEITPRSFADVLDINVTGTWNAVMAAAPHLIERGGGSVILISSAAGIKMQPFMIHYTTSKHALVGMARGFAAELGNHNIRVNTVHPGAVNSPMGSGSMVERLTATAATNPRLQGMGMPFLNQFMAEPEEIAGLVAYLAGDEAKFISAAAFAMDGGQTVF